MTDYYKIDVHSKYLDEWHVLIGELGNKFLSLEEAKEVLKEYRSRRTIGKCRIVYVVEQVVWEGSNERL